MTMQLSLLCSSQIIQLGGELDETLGRDGRKEIERKMRGKKGNAPIYRP